MNTGLVRKTYRKLIKKINSFGSIRGMNSRFLEDRRKILLMKTDPEKKIDDYFECCKLNVSFLENMRLKNFRAIKTSLMKRSPNKRQY